MARSLFMAFPPFVPRSPWRLALAPAIPLLTLAVLAAASVLLAQEPDIPAEFQNPFKTVTIRADSQRKVKDVFSLAGHVEVSNRQARVSADEATYNESTHQVEASGHVSFSDSKAYLEAGRATYNVKTGAGTFSDVHGYVLPREHARPGTSVPSGAFLVRAREVDRLDENTYIVLNARLTSCQNECTGWSLAVRSARLTVGDKAVSYGDVFRFFGVPLFYAPVLEHSMARTPRQSGFLIPSIGNSSQKGRIIGEGVYWAINPSADLMLGVDDYSLRGIATLGRFRATPSDTSQLALNYYEVNDHGSGPLRAERASGEQIRALGESQDLGGGFRGVMNMDYINSLAFRLTWSGNFNEAVSSEARQAAFASKSFDGYSVNFYGERYEDFLCAQQSSGSSTSPQNPCNTEQALFNHIIIRHTPSVSFGSLDHQIGNSPFYFDFDAAADGVGREEPGFRTPLVSERVDFHPRITLRAPDFWGFHFTPTAGVEATQYGTSLLGPHDPLTRVLGDVSFDLRPPSLERVFRRPVHHYRLKHVIEPDIRYNLVRAAAPREITDIVRFDQTDILAETNEIEYSVKTTLYGRPEEPGSPGAPAASGGTQAPTSAASQSSASPAREIVSLSLNQKYYFDPTFGGALAPGQNVFAPTIGLTGFAFAQGRRLSPVVTVLKIAPFSNYDTELRADFSPSGGGVLNAGISSAVHHGEFGFEATDFFVDREQAFGLVLPIVPSVPVSQLLSSNLFNTRVSYGKPGRKGLSAAFGVNYNITEGLANALVGQVSYDFSCFGIDLGYNRFSLGPLRNENQFRIAISLSNVGSFGNLRTRDRLYQ